MCVCACACMRACVRVCVCVYCNVDRAGLLATGSLMTTWQPVAFLIIRSGMGTVTLVVLLWYCYFDSVTSMMFLWCYHFATVTSMVLLRYCYFATVIR